MRTGRPGARSCRRDGMAVATSIPVNPAPITTTVSRAGLACRWTSLRRCASSRVAPAMVSTSNRPAVPGTSGRMTRLPAASTSRAKGSDAAVPSGRARSARPGPGPSGGVMPVTVACTCRTSTGSSRSRSGTRIRCGSASYRRGRITRSGRSLTIVTGMSGSPRLAWARTRLAAAAAPDAWRIRCR